MALISESIINRVVSLAKNHVSGGTVVCLGANNETLAAAFTDVCLKYLALEITPDAITLHHALLQIMGEKGDVGLVIVLEWFEEAESFLKLLAETPAAPCLLLSMPNLANTEVILNLLAGEQPAYHNGYTAKGLLELATSTNWQLLETNNIHSLPQQIPPILKTPGFPGPLVAYFAEILNPFNLVSHFVWLLKPGATPVTKAETPVKRPLVSILIRTQGLRHELLLEALYSLLAQDDDDYEVLLCVHMSDERQPEIIENLQILLAKLLPTLQEKIRIIECIGGSRSTPLNLLMEEATGDFFTFLDDDDMLFPQHVSTLNKGVQQHGKRVIYQTFGSQRRVEVLNGAKSESLPWVSSTYPYTVTQIHAEYIVKFTPLAEQGYNYVPICCYHVPRIIIEETLLRFREEYQLGEDWDFLMRITQVLPIVTLEEITSVVNVRNNNTNTVGSDIMLDEWKTFTDKRLDWQEQLPLVIDGRLARTISKTHFEQIGREELFEETLWENTQLKIQIAELRGAYDTLLQWSQELVSKIEAIQQSLSFKTTTKATMLMQGSRSKLRELSTKLRKR